MRGGGFLTCFHDMSSYKDRHFVPRVLQSSLFAVLTAGFKDLSGYLSSHFFFFFSGNIKRKSKTSKIVLISRTGFWPDETSIIDIAKGLGLTATVVSSTLDLLASSLPTRPRMPAAPKQSKTCALVSQSEPFFDAFRRSVCVWISINHKIGSMSQRDEENGVLEVLRSRCVHMVSSNEE